MLAIKRIMKKRENQILNIKIAQIKSLTGGLTAEVRKQNWQLIEEELDKIGINIGEENLLKIRQGVQAPIDKLFERIERYSKIIAGPQFLNFEGLGPCDLNESQDDDFIE